jgi:rhodanese-related sulfurtransferase
MFSSYTKVSTRVLTGQLLALLLLLAPISSARAEKPLAPESMAGVTTVNAEQSIELILSNPELVVVDARLPEEFQKGHIEGAIHLVDHAVNEVSLAQILARKDSPVLFYCNGPRCLRSSRAAQEAMDHGYSQIYWFRDGWASWLEKELPVVR